MESKNIFQERLVEARKKRGLSQDDLANKTKLQASAISHFETGSRKPSFDNLKRLADALEITSDYLLGRTDDPSGIIENDPIYRDFENLTAKDRDTARDFMKTLVKRSKKKEGT